MKFEDDIFDKVIAYKSEKQLNMSSKVFFGSKIFPVQIVSHKNLPCTPLVAPLYDNDGNWIMDEKGKPLGYFRLEQKIQTLIDSRISLENRVTFIKGDLEDLLSRVKKYDLKDGSSVDGKIVIEESLEPQDENHQSEASKSDSRRGFTINGRFYPVYRQYIYTVDENANDALITIEQARAYANSIDTSEVDLPF